MLRFLVPVLLIASYSVFGKISVGVDLSCSLDNNTVKDNSATVNKRISHKNTYSIVPFLGIYPNKLVEIDPFLGLYITSTSTEIEYENTTPTTKSTTRQLSIEPGCGVFFHVIKGEVFDISLGPKFGYRLFFEPNHTTNDSNNDEYDSYYEGNTSIGCQFNIDLLFSKRFASRLSTNLFKFNYHSYSYEFENNPSKNEGHTISADFKTIFQPSFGLLFTF